MAMIVVMLPCFLWLPCMRKHGQPLEVGHCKEHHTDPVYPPKSERPYQTENLYARLGTEQRALRKGGISDCQKDRQHRRGQPPPQQGKRKLTRAEKKQIAALIRQAKGDGKAHTAQQTIPYLADVPGRYLSGGHSG